MAEDERQLRKRIGRRAANKIINRRKIITTAKGMIEEGGVMSLSPARVAEEADVGHGTFYSYFADSEALIEAVIDEAKRDLFQLVGKSVVASDGFSEALRNIVSAAVSYAGQHPKLYQLAIQNTLFLSDRFSRQVNVRMEVSAQIVNLLERYVPDDNEEAYEELVGLANKVALLLPAARPGSLWDAQGLLEQALHYLSRDIADAESWASGS